MSAAGIREILRELRHELPVGVVRAFEDGFLTPFEAWARLERLLGRERLAALLEGRGVELRAVDRAAVAYQRGLAGRRAWSKFEPPKGARA